MTQQSLEPRTTADDAGEGTRVPAGRSWLDRYFHLSLRGSSVAREVRGGVTTFMAMAYILLLNRSWTVGGGEPVHWHAPNGLGRTGPRRTRPRGGDTHPVRGPIPGGQFPTRPGHMATARGDGEALNHHSGGAGAPHAGTAPASQIARSR